MNRYISDMINDLLAKAATHLEDNFEGSEDKIKGGILHKGLWYRRGDLIESVGYRKALIDVVADLRDLRISLHKLDADSDTADSIKTIVSRSLK